MWTSHHLCLKSLKGGGGIGDHIGQSNSGYQWEILGFWTMAHRTDLDITEVGK